MPRRSSVVAVVSSLLAVAIASLSMPAGAAPVAGLHPGKESFLALPPEDGFLGGNPTISRPDCKAAQIDAAAFTEPSPDGVLGVVELKGTAFHHVKHFGRLRCALPITKGPRSFIAADGSAVAVPRGVADTTNEANDAFSYADLNDGKASWGFGWFGTYCGAAPRYVVMKLRGKRGTLNVPYDGPTPPCPAGPAVADASMLTDGTAGGPGTPVQPAPPSFVGLTASAQFLGPVSHHEVSSVEVTISDSGAAPVDLIPCPIYEVQTEDHTGKHVHFGSAVIDNKTPGCKHTPVTVGPDQPVSFRVGHKALEPGTTFTAPKGSTYDVHVELAGIPTATVSTTVV